MDIDVSNLKPNCYKIVALTLDLKRVSYFMGLKRIQNILFSKDKKHQASLRVSYAERKTTYPKIGKLFVFIDKVSALDYKLLDYHLSQEVWSAFATDLEPCRIMLEPTIIRRYQDLLLTFWENPSEFSKDIYLQYTVSPPPGTWTASSVTLIDRIH
jgi:hypothetical protein